MGAVAREVWPGLQEGVDMSETADSVLLPVVLDMSETEDYVLLPSTLHDVRPLQVKDLFLDGESTQEKIKKLQHNKRCKELRLAKKLKLEKDALELERLLGVNKHLKETEEKLKNKKVKLEDLYLQLIVEGQIDFRE